MGVIMAKIVCSGGPLGGEVLEVTVAPGQTFEIDGSRYRRDASDLELAVFTGRAAGADAPVFGSRVAAALAARGSG